MGADLQVSGYRCRGTGVGVQSPWSRSAWPTTP